MGGRKRRGGALGEFPDPSDSSLGVVVGGVYEVSRASLFGDDTVTLFMYKDQSGPDTRVRSSVVERSLKPGDTFLVIEQVQGSEDGWTVLSGGTIGRVCLDEFYMSHIVRRSVDT